MNEHSKQELTTVNDDGEIIDVDVGHASLAIGLTRAEIDTQIATAHKFPRSIKRATDDILSLATLDEETADDCMYALPRAGKAIQGPSIRLAEIIAQCWGNNRVAARVVHVDRIEKYVEAEGVYHDLQTNSASMARVRRRISDKRGKILTDDMIIVTGNAACSIAKRNAILGGVPKGVWKKAYEAALSVVAGTVETLTSRRDKSLKAFANFGVTPEQIFAALDVEGVEDIDLHQIPILRGMFAALRNGEATVEEMFARPGHHGGGVQHKVVENPLSDKKVEPEKAPEQKAAPETVPEQKAAPEEPKDETSWPLEEGGKAPPTYNENTEPEPENDAQEPEQQTHVTNPFFDAGTRAAASGRSRKAAPAELREPGRENDLEQWIAGFDAHVSATKAANEGGKN